MHVHPDGETPGPGPKKKPAAHCFRRVGDMDGSGVDVAVRIHRKRAFGPWMLRLMGLLRHGKALRGTWADPFGRTEERRAERALPDEFQACLAALLALDPDEAALLAWIEAWAGIRGYGPVKTARLAAARMRIAALDRALREARAA